MQGRRIVGRSRICLVPPAHCQTCGIKARSGKRAGEAYFSHGNLGTRRLDALHLVAKGTVAIVGHFEKNYSSRGSYRVMSNDYLCFEEGIKVPVDV